MGMIGPIIHGICCAGESPSQHIHPFEQGEPFAFDEDSHLMKTHDRARVSITENNKKLSPPPSLRQQRSKQLTELFNLYLFKLLK